MVWTLEPELVQRVLTCLPLPRVVRGLRDEVERRQVAGDSSAP
jgi:hypothetical protein